MPTRKPTSGRTDIDAQLSHAAEAPRTDPSTPEPATSAPTSGSRVTSATRRSGAAVPNPRPTKTTATSEVLPSAASNVPAPDDNPVPTPRAVRGHQPAGSPNTRDPQSLAAAGPDRPAPMFDPTPELVAARDTQPAPAAPAPTPGTSPEATTVRRQRGHQPAGGHTRSDTQVLDTAGTQPPVSTADPSPRLTTTRDPHSAPTVEAPPNPAAARNPQRPTPEVGPTPRDTAVWDTQPAASHAPTPVLPAPHQPPAAILPPAPEEEALPGPTTAAVPITTPGVPPLLHNDGEGDRPDPTDHAATLGVLTLLDPALALAADIVDDLERVRIANQNRLRQLTRHGPDKDGRHRGFGLTDEHPDVANLTALVTGLEQLETAAVKNLQTKMRKHPLGPWVKAQRGVGDKQAARLLACIGDPYWRPQLVYEDEDGTIIRTVPAGPRTVSALWAYCGLHVLPAGQVSDGIRSINASGDAGHDTDHGTTGTPEVAPVGVAARRRKGVRSNWSTKAKMRTYLIAESCVKQLDAACRGGHVVADAHTSSAAAAGVTPDQRPDHCMDDVRNYTVGASTVDSPRGSDTQDGFAVPAPATPSVPVGGCRCSPYRLVYERRRAHTATTHPEWTDGHSHQDALRIASKAILKDLWRAAATWHGLDPDEDLHTRQHKPETSP